MSRIWWVDFFSTTFGGGVERVDESLGVKKVEYLQSARL